MSSSLAEHRLTGQVNSIKKGPASMENRILNDHRDNRGFVVNPFEHLSDTGDISNCHAFTIEPGCIRGNHTHEDRNEQVLVLAGEVTVTTPGEIAVLTAKTPSLLTIPKGVSHTFRNRGSEAAAVICWSSWRAEDE